MKARGYSLWFMPAGDVRDKFSGIISRLSARVTTPAFEPHVTLIGQVPGPEDEIIKKAGKLASMIRPFDVRLSEIGCLDHYFRCLFVRAEETREILEANEKTRELFGRIGDPKYMPHLSLVYGNLPQEEKEKIIEEIGRVFSDSFRVNSIHVVLTTGEPMDWRKVKEIFLG